MQPMRRTILTGLVLCSTSWTIVGVAAPADAASAAVVLEDRFGNQVPLAEGESRQVGQYGLGEPAQVYVAKGYRATFCENAGTKARCRRLVGGIEDPPTAQTPAFSAVGTIVKVEKALFGFADLHVHPATHLAWGARGGFGLLWGQPGMAHTSADPETDLQACLLHTHSLSTDPIEAGARFALLQKKGGDHGPSGFPSFSDWPKAESVVHQQMHVTMLRRAFEGGLRLIVASATDNQMLDIIWNPEFSISQGRFALRADADYKAAAEQFDFIQRFVSDNASWMTIVKTPTQARIAIGQNKLAVVLGLEMDQLSVEEILDLKAKYGVALVVPVHLVNNSFGGAAVYEDFFNVANFVMTGSLFDIEGDSSLNFRFPGISSAFTSLPIVGPLIKPAAARLNEYFNVTKGHRNQVGMRDNYGLRRLMKAGLLIDTAHMGSKSTDATLTLARKFGYPLVHSHGGLRSGPEASERSMSTGQFEALVDSDGILGLGTGSDGLSPMPINEWLQSYLEVASLGPVALGTDLNGMAEQIRRSELTLPYPSAQIRNADWTGRTGTLPRFVLGDKHYDISRDGIAHIGMLPDFLAVARRWAAVQRKTRELDQIFHSSHDFIATWEQAVQAHSSVDAALPVAPISKVALTIETGTDNLKCGRVIISAWDQADRQLSLPLQISSGQKPHTTWKKDLFLLPGTQLRDIDRIQVWYLPGQCSLTDTGDTWNIKTLKVAYSVVVGGSTQQGVLMHKRGAPAKHLDRGSRWDVDTEH